MPFFLHLKSVVQNWFQVESCLTYSESSWRWLFWGDTNNRKLRGIHVERTLLGWRAPSVGEAASWDVWHSFAGIVRSTETAASHGRTTPLLRGSCQQGPERRDPLVSGATSWGQELQNLLCSHSTWLLTFDVCLAFSARHAHWTCRLFINLLSFFILKVVIFWMTVTLKKHFVSCSLTEPTIWWTLVETLTDGARRYKRCGEGFIKGTKTPAYRSRVPPLAARSSLALRPFTEQRNTLFSALHHRNVNKLLETLASRPCLFSRVEPLGEKIQHWIQGCFACSLCSLWGFYCIFPVWMIRLLPCTSAFCSLCWKEESGQLVLLRDTNLGTSRTIWKAWTGFLLWWYHNTKSSFLWTRADPDIFSKPYLNPASYTSCCRAPLLVHTPHSCNRYCKLVMSHVYRPPSPPKKSNSIYSFSKATYSRIFLSLSVLVLFYLKPLVLDHCSPMKVLM